VLGRGRGLGSVLQALRGTDAEVTAIVTTAEAAGAGASPDTDSESAVADVRRSLEALSGEEVALSRAMRRSLTIERRGRRPLGNLLLQSLSSGFGDLGEASLWLGEQLGIAGRVVPATAVPLAVNAIREADLVLLAPGRVRAGVTVASAIPDIGSALRATAALVIWICNLRSEKGETASEQLAILRAGDVRVDAILYDPSAGAPVRLGEVRRQGVAPFARRLAKRGGEAHDAQLLCAALADVSSQLRRRA
jgi:2-phospho-L-lactate transferase/gluconeogenesis factor (CofD/UPF0052 family)